MHSIVYHKVDLYSRFEQLGNNSYSTQTQTGVKFVNASPRQ